MSKLSEEKKSLLEEIKLKKKSLLVMRLKLSSGDSVSLKDLKGYKKEIAKLFTKFNSLKV